VNIVNNAIDDKRKFLSDQPQKYASREYSGILMTLYFLCPYAHF